MEFFSWVASEMEIITSVAGKLAEYTVEPIWQQFVYLVGYKEHIKKLDVELKKLGEKRVGVQLLVEDAKRNAKVVGPDVVSWLEKVDLAEKDSKELLRNRIGARRVNALNLKLRYSLGKKASNMTRTIIQPLQDGDFKTIAYPAPTNEDYVSTSTTGLTARISVREDIMQALKNDDINVIGIYGAGETERTKMVKEVIERAITEKLFVDYVIVQTQDEKAIQDEIAHKLSKPLGEKESVDRRADNLRENILKNGKKILVTLDNTSEKLDFEKVGLPVQPYPEGWKFIVSMRSEDACKRMNCQTQFTISYPSSKNMTLESSFTSRTLVMEEIMQALKNDETYMIGICGAGGIGKTKMAKDVMDKARAEKLFEEFVVAVVSQTPDERAIQGQIADELGLRFEDKESVSGRAKKLRTSMLANEKKILVVLDDVWEKLDFDKVGLPLEPNNKKRKFIFTTRSEDVCVQMNCQKKFKIAYLPKEEAWKLFQGSAGSCVDDPLLHPIAEAVADECGGLPLAIVIVGRALENKHQDVWEHALQQLQKSAPSDITGMHKHVFSRIQLSYNYLESKEAKSCFLLCCLFPEDEEIPIEILVKYGMGLKLFEDVDTIMEARNRVHALVNKLKRSFLLLNTDKEYHVKMHDVVRDFAISIGSKDEPILVRCNVGLDEWPQKDSYEHYSRISLQFSENAKFPVDSLEFTNLKLLQLFCNSWIENDMDNIPGNFFQGMKGLAVLALLKNHTPLSLPPFLEVLKNLQSLFLHGCSKIEGLSIIGSLEKLEILSLVGSRIRIFPREVGRLKHLKLLDLSECGSIQRMERGTLSCLSRLEELYMVNTFDDDWVSIKEEYREETNASLVELKALSHLKILAIEIPAYASMAREFPYGNLTKFTFIVSIPNFISDWEGRLELPFENTLVLCDDERSRVFYPLLQKTDNATFQKLKYLENDLCDLDINSCFARLKRLHLDSCEKLKYIVDWSRNKTPEAVFPRLKSLEIRYLENLEEICHGQPSKKSSPEALRSSSSTWLTSFGNLRSLLLFECPRLKSMFSMSIARGLTLLQHLEVKRCYELEETISKTGEDDEKINNEIGLFPKLTNLELIHLPKLMGINSISFRSKVVSAEGNDMSTHQRDDFAKPSQLYDQPDMGSSYVLLVITHSLRLSKLQSLYIRDCDSLQAIFYQGLNVKEKREQTRILDQLAGLTILELPALTHVWKNVKPPTQGFGNLTSLRIESCKRLRNLFPFCIAELLVKLESLKVKDCEMMESIVEKEEEIENTHDVMDLRFPKLNLLKLKCLPNFTTFWADASTLALPSLARLSISKCPIVKTFDHVINTSSSLQRKSTDCTTKSSSAVPKTKNVSDGSGTSMCSYHGFSRWLSCCGSMKTKLPSGSDSPSITNSTDEMNVIPPSDVLNPNEVDQMMMMSKLIDLSIKDMNNMLHIWTDKVDGGFIPSHLMNRMNNLERMDVSRCKSLETIFHMERPKTGDERDFKGFRNLKMLDVERCNNLKYLFSSHVVELLVELEDVRVIECNMIEEIVRKFAVDQEDQDQQPIYGEKIKSTEQHGGVSGLMMFKNLKNLKIVSCNNLRILSHVINRMMNNLEKMEVSGCQSLETIFHIERRPKSVDVLPMLKELVLKDLPKLGQIWKNIGEGDFKNLKRLDVYGCRNLKYLFSSDVAELLVELEEVYVINCSMMEEIVVKLGKDDQGDQDHQPIHDEKIKSTEQNGGVFGLMMFKNLKNLKIVRCNNLRLPSHIINRMMNNLERMVLYGCQALETIFHIERRPTSVDVLPMLNCLKELVLWDFPKLEQIWNNIGHEGDFKNLKRLEVQRCHKLKYLFSCHVAEHLVELEEVIVTDCGMMEEIVGKLGTDDQEDQDHQPIHDEKIKSSEQHGRRVVGLIMFKKLKNLEIYSCDNLRHVFSGSFGTRGLEQLQMLDIYNCKMMEHIVAAVANEENEKEAKATTTMMNNKIVFPQLATLSLWSLPKMERFCQGNNYVMELPSLKKLVLNECPMIRDLSHEFSFDYKPLLRPY